MRFTVEGMYHGKVILTVEASTVPEAIKKFEDANEDDIEVTEPSKIEPNYDSLARVK